jgi:universal stress protein A
MQPKPQQVVVAYDFSEHGRAVLDRAVALVSRAPFHVLHFVTVIDGNAGIPALPLEGGKADHQYADRLSTFMTEKIGEVLQALDNAPEIHFFVHARIGKPADEILDLAKDVGADLIFIGTHGKTGIQRLVMGSVAEAVVRQAECPVMVVRTKTYPDVELVQITEVARHEPIRRFQRFSYSNRAILTRPNDWPLS